MIPEFPKICRLTVTGTGADGTAISRAFATTPPAIGDILTTTGAGNAGSDHVVFVEKIVDGSRQVVLDVVV